MKKILAALWCLLSCASACFAADTYLSVKGGAFLPNNDAAGLNGYSAGYGAEVAYGLKVHRNLAVELGSGYYRATSNRLVVMTEPDINGQAVTVTVGPPAVSVIPITATLKGLLPLGSVAVLSAGGGIGYYHARIENFSDTSGILPVFGNANAGAFGYHLVAGVDFNLTRSLSLGEEVKYLSVKPQFDFSGDKREIQLGGTAVNTVLRYRF